MSDLPVASLKSKWGPLPVWAWGAIAGVLALVAYFVYARAGGDGGNATTPTNLDQSGYQTVGIPSGSTGDSSGSTTEPAAPAQQETNREWVSKCVKYLSNRGVSSPSAIQAGLTKYINGNPITSAERTYVDRAIAYAGLPPEGVFGISDTIKPVVTPPKTTPKPAIPAKPAPAKPVVKPTPKPVVKPTPKPVVKPTPKPVVKPVVKPPVTKPVTKPVVSPPKNVVAPVKNVVKPVTKPVAKPSKPATPAKPAAKPKPTVVGTFRYAVNGTIYQRYSDGSKKSFLTWAQYQKAGSPAFRDTLLNGSPVVRYIRKKGNGSIQAVGADGSRNSFMSMAAYNRVGAPKYTEEDGI